MSLAVWLRRFGLGPNATPPPTGIAQGRPLASSPASFPQGPPPGSRLSPEFVAEIGRFAYVFGWPLMNIYNRYTAIQRVWRPRLVGGIVPVAPINHLAMLHDYIDSRQRYITCPSHDLVYGFGILDLEREPVIVQVPDFGKRFFVYQATDQRTDGFADIGTMYGTRPGFYLLVGPDWTGAAPEGIEAIFRATTNIGTIIPRVFQEDVPADNAALQPLLRQIMAYPLSEFDRTIKTSDWENIGNLPWVKLGDGEWRWVDPSSFFDVLPKALDAAPPLPGEEALYALIRSALDAASNDRTLRQELRDAATEADESFVAPLLEFRNFGIPLPYNWTTVVNSAQFGTDYYTRTAVARSNIFINRPHETRYFYQDLDRSGARLNGEQRYTVTFAELPPVKGFWSLTLYNRHHFFAPNEIERFSLGTKSKDLRIEPDGSLIIYVQRDRPSGDKLANWLPCPNDEFSLFIRAYWPDAPIAEGKWTPPAVAPV
jgi:hypothetical protein